MGKLSNKIAIITGGAGSIGKTTSLLFAREGASIIIIDINQNRGKKAIDEVKKIAPNSIFIQADLTKSTEVNHVFRQVINKFDRVDILINIVGGTRSIRLDDTDDDTIDQDINLNLKSALLCTKAILEPMREQQKGSIIYTSSVNALLGGFSQTTYACAKAGLHSLAQTLTADYSKESIRFNVVCLGTIPCNSPRWQERLNQDSSILDNLASMYPMKKYGEPIDAAYAMLFLASDDSKWITGITLPVDGGITACGGFKGGEWWK